MRLCRILEEISETGWSHWRIRRPVWLALNAVGIITTRAFVSDGPSYPWVYPRWIGPAYAHCGGVR